MFKHTAAAFALIVSTTAVSADSHGNHLVMSGPLNGEVFIMAQNHFSLYTYDKDTKNTSNCYGACAQKWPPAILDAAQAADMPKNYTLISRTDGTMQVAFKGQPLYLWHKDRKIGDMKGVGVSAQWHLARPK